MPHTPGPWRVSQAKSGRYYIYAGSDVQPLKPEVKLNKSGVTKEMESNIHLMSAAPDLYGALSELFEVSADLYDEPLPLTLRIRVERALNKAEGKA